MLVLALLAAVLPGQQPSAPAPAGADPKAIEARDAQLVRKAVLGLHDFADLLTAQKQHRRALELRREIWMDYAEDDAKAREATGFVRVGELWRIDAAKAVLDRDLQGDKSKLKKIDRDLARFEQQLCAEHRSLAEAWTAAGDAVRAGRHWRRVLRYAPEDAAANAALEIREFDRFAGTAHDLDLLQHGRAIRGAVDWLNRTPFPVQVLEGQPCALLAAAGIQHTGVQSEFFRVSGSLPVAELQAVAQGCERALLLAQTLFGVAGGEPFRPQLIRTYVFVRNQAEYEAALQVCKDQFTTDRYEFLRTGVDQCFVEHQGAAIRLHKSEGGVEVAQDQAVRGVMQDAVGVRTDGLWEGVGHMACGFLFGRTLTFLLEQQKDRTVASFTQRTLAPDLAVWMQIAQESAWAKSDTRTSELVLLSAARFTTEQRVKAWAICHYFVHWRPQYVLELDRCRSEQVRTPPDVEAEFLKRTGYELPRIDAEWRDFWGRGEELRKAMAKDPLAGVPAKEAKAAERARALVDAVNAARAAARVGPLGWMLVSGGDLVLVRRYERELQKAEAEQQKRDRQPGKHEPVTMPAPPAALGKTIVWSRQPEAGAAVDEWFSRPALRELLLHPGRSLLGVPIDSGGFLLDVASPAEPTTRGGPMFWPRAGQRDVETTARADALGPRALAALAARGVRPDAMVGMPLTAHFLRPIEPALLARIECSVRGNRGLCDGVLVVYAGGGDADPAPGLDLAPGCVAFVPLAPLPAGEELTVDWRFPTELVGKDDAPPLSRFRTR